MFKIDFREWFNWVDMIEDKINALRFGIWIQVSGFIDTKLIAYILIYMRLLNVMCSIGWRILIFLFLFLVLFLLMFCVDYWFFYIYGFFIFKDWYCLIFSLICLGSIWIIILPIPQRVSIEYNKNSNRNFYLMTH